MEETKIFIEIGPELAGAMKNLGNIFLEHNKLAAETFGLDFINIGYELQRIFKLDLTKIMTEQIKHKK